MEKVRSSEIRVYSQDELHNLMAVSAALTVAQEFDALLDLQGRDSMVIQHGLGSENTRPLIVDRDLVFRFNRIGFFLFEALVKNNLGDEAKAVVKESGPKQRINRKRLMEIDKEYNLNGAKRSF